MKRIENISDELKKGSTGSFIDKNSTKWTLLNGKFHSFNDEPAIYDLNTYKVWYWNGLEHREDGPARINKQRAGYISYGYYFYGILADSKKQFEDPNWRKLIEIKVFL